jgi:hypothetical protein
MVLFHCGHLASLSQIIALRYNRHPNEEAVLLVSSWAFTDSLFAKKLTQIGVFSKIILCPSWFSQPEKTIEAQETVICQRFDALCETNAICLDEFSVIYSACDVANEFAIYCSINKIDFELIEACAEQFQDIRRDSVQERFANADPSFTAINKKYDALSGANNAFVKKRLRFDYSGLEHVGIPDKDEWIDFAQLLQSISQDCKKLIVSCLDEKIRYLRDDKTCLLLTNSSGFSMNQSNLKGKNINLPYQILLDYYMYPKDSLVFVKAHPHEFVNTPVVNDIEDGISIDTNIPIELYNLDEEFYVSKTLSVITTSAGKIAERIRQDVRVGDRFFQNFRLCHKLFFAFTLAQQVCTPKTVHHARIIDQDFLVKFARLCIAGFGEYEPKDLRGNILNGDIFTVIDVVPPENQADIIAALTNAEPLTKVIFLNTKNDAAFFAPHHLELLDYIVPITIRKTATKENCIADIDDEVFYFFCKDPDIRRKAEQFSMEKTLKYTKIKLEIFAQKLFWQNITNMLRKNTNLKEDR